MVSCSSENIHQLKEYLISLNDESLMNLSEHYLVANPKDKNEIIRQMMLLIQDNNYQKEIIKLLDYDDLLILNAIDCIFNFSLSSSKMEDDNEKFFLRIIQLLYPMRIQQLKTNIQNLKDRLLIMVDSKNHHIKINPVLKNILTDKLKDVPILPIRKIEQTTDKTINSKLILPSLIQAILTILEKYNGQKEWHTEMYNVLGNQINSNYIDEIIQALEIIELIDNNQKVIFKNLKKFSSLNTDSQIAKLYTTLAVNILPEIDKNALYLLFITLWNFAEKYQFHEYSIVRIYNLNSNIPIKRKQVDQLLLLLERYSIIEKNFDTRYYTVNKNYLSKKSLKIENDFTFFYPCDQPFYATIVASCTLIQYDIFSRYELSREKFLKAIDDGFTKDELIVFFTKISHNPHQLSQTLHHWFDSSNLLNLYHGYVLCIDSFYEHIMHNKYFVDNFILRTLTSNVVLLKNTPDEKFYEFIKTQGLPKPNFKKVQLEPLSQENNSSSSDFLDNVNMSMFSSLMFYENFTNHEQTVKQSNLFHSAKNILHHTLIERKLIWNSNQLNLIRDSSKQISGLNFPIKIHFIEIAIKEKKDLLVHLKHHDGEKELHLLPIEFDKKKSPQIKAYDYRVKQLVSFDIAAIIYIEIIKGSLIV